MSDMSRLLMGCFQALCCCCRSLPLRQRAHVAHRSLQLLPLRPLMPAAMMDQFLVPYIFISRVSCRSSCAGSERESAGAVDSSGAANVFPTAVAGPCHKKRGQGATCTHAAAVRNRHAADSMSRRIRPVCCAYCAWPAGGCKPDTFTFPHGAPRGSTIPSSCPPRPPWLRPLNLCAT